MQDHPRGCGEHSHARHELCKPQGSSPRMRGALGLDVINRRGKRIIPADAGSTSGSRRASSCQKDHPRGCGEHVVALDKQGGGHGSSPRMRGAHIPGLIPANQTRIIPADAGSTPQQRSGKGRYKDHPRGCGEHSVIEDGVEMAQGSSPRMRGAPCIASVVPNDVWIIPADAGSTWADNAEIDVNEDHPRGCGEHDGRQSHTQGQDGSSPRMRGALPGPVGIRHRRGIIPADAGSTQPHQAPAPPARDHPRGCGEHQTIRTQPIRRAGSSPRMRGAPGHGKFAACQHGIIPADAGSTG